VAIQRQSALMRCGFEWMDEDLEGLLPTPLDEIIFFFDAESGELNKSLEKYLI